MKKLLGSKDQYQAQSKSSLFKNNHSLAERAERRASLNSKYPEGQYIVFVLEGLSALPFTGNAPKPYMLIGLQRKMNVVQLIAYIKKNLAINQNRSLFAEVGGVVISMSSCMQDLSYRFTQPDGFVYVRIKAEDIF